MEQDRGLAKINATRPMLPRVGRLRAVALFLFLAVCGSAATAGEILYNGIQLPAVWPPKAAALPATLPTPYYLINPPKVIPIDVGRQLFVDDFLITHTTLTRTWYKADYHPMNPVLKGDQTWEMEPATNASIAATNEAIPSAMTFYGGIAYDPKDRLFKIWYSVLGRYLCLATSTDGIHWTKPKLDVVRHGTNIVRITSDEDIDTTMVWLDLLEPDPSRRYKAHSVWLLGNLTIGHIGYFSADGVHWGGAAFKYPGYGDGSSFFYNPFRKVWVLSLRDSARYWPLTGPNKKNAPFERTRRYHEGPDFLSAARWGTVPRPDMKGLPGEVDESVPWTRADVLDEHIVGSADAFNVFPGVYDLQANAYESIIIGGFSIIPGYLPSGIKANYGALGFSRDGFTWDRPNRKAFLERGAYPAWNTGYIHFAGGVCLVVRDKLYFYLGARSPQLNGTTPIPGTRQYVTGLATLRRDGFASMDAGVAEGTLTTRPVRFSGRYLFVNLAAPKGSLRAEILDEQGRILAVSTPARADRTAIAMSWLGIRDLSSLAGRPVRFRFHLTNGKLYSFWVSPDTSGASHGYVAAGGPGFTGPTDTVGSLGQQ